MDLNNLLFGKPLRSSDEAGEKLGPIGGLSVFGLDALSSAAYGPEAALTLLIVLGAAGISYIVPITVSIIILLTIVYFSYRQTIQAYPNGGGSYTVARENLGEFPGLLAAAALMIDYVLTAAVGISAGVGALVSAAPSLLSHTLAICIVILLLITLVNLRGARETGAVFIFPTYIFIGTLLITLFIGLFKTLAAGGHPSPVVVPPTLPLPTAAVSLWLLLKAFSSGCTAMTGVEAVSNGVKAFRDPVVKSAQRALTAIIAILIVLSGGNRLPGSRLPYWRHRPRQGGVSECAVTAHRRSCRAGSFLLHLDGLHPAGAGALGQHRLCGLSPDSAAPWPRTCIFPPASPRADGVWCTRKAFGCSRCCAAGCCSSSGESRTG